MPFKIPQVQTADRILGQIQTNIARSIEPLFSLLSGNFQVSLTGCTVPVTGIASWQRSVVGGPVCLNLPALTGTSNTTSATLTGLPNSLWPQDIQYVSLPVENNTALASGIVVIDTDGSMTLWKSFSSAVFTNSGIKGVIPITITYMTVG